MVPLQNQSLGEGLWRKMRVGGGRKLSLSGQQSSLKTFEQNMMMMMMMMIVMIQHSAISIHKSSRKTWRKKVWNEIRLF